MSTTTDLWRRLKAQPPLLCAVGLAAAATLIYVLPWIWAVHTQLVHNVHAVDLTQRDFVNYWMGARMALAGTEIDLFTHDIYFARLQELFGANIEIRSWSYPPHFLLMLWPLGYLDYLPALGVFLAVTLALFLTAVWVFRAAFAPQSHVAILCCALLAFVLMQLDATQNGFLTAAFLLFGLAWMKERPLLAGLAFACLTIKPQLGFLIPVLLLWNRNWLALLWSCVFTLALVSASIVCFGLDSWSAYLGQTLAYQRSVMSDWSGTFLLMMPTAFGSARAIGLSPGIATLVQWAASLMGAALVVRLLRCDRDPLHRAFVVACGTFLMTPYAFNYDMGALSVIAAIVASAPPIASQRAAATVMAGIGALAGIVTNLGRSGVPVAPLVLAIGLIALSPPAALTRVWRFALERDVLSGKKVDDQGRARAEDEREQRHAAQ
ncbi:MAG TPA: glycosyltransferase family 87 protein [Steroidobacteraceae bacterium]|nr:glycosyltransferase family 87 protein [Steroidobacteraceae bacterium]